MTTSTTVPTTDGQHAPAASPRFGYLPTLDGWRAVAVVLVMLVHGSDSIRHVVSPAVFRHLGPIETYGWFGVQIFFALSGFLVCSRLLHERQVRGRIDVRQFYLRRAFRILPASLAYLIAAGVLALVGVLHFDLRTWLITLGCLSNYFRSPVNYLGHYWSLAVEEHFYLLWPFLLLRTRTWRRGLLTAAGLAVAVTVWRVVNFRFMPPAAAGFSTFWARTDLQADGLLWGCVLAFLYVEGPARDRLSALLRRPLWTLAALIMVASVFWHPHDWKLRQALLVGFRVSAPLVIVGTVLHPTGVVGRVLESRPFRIVGRLSYSIYLWQMLFLEPEGARLPAFGRFQTLPWNVVGVAACAWLSYTCIEQPLLRLGHRLTSKRPTPGALPRHASAAPAGPPGALSPSPTSIPIGAAQ